MVNFGIIYSPVLFDFIKMKILFKKEHKLIELRGIIEGAKFQVTFVGKVQKSLKELVMGFAGKFVLVEAIRENRVSKNSKNMIRVEKLLEDYAEVFKEPANLPSKIRFDHRIPLKLEA